MKQVQTLCVIDPELALAVPETWDRTSVVVWRYGRASQIPTPVSSQTQLPPYLLEHRKKKGVGAAQAGEGGALTVVAQPIQHRPPEQAGVLGCEALVAPGYGALCHGGA